MNYKKRLFRRIYGRIMSSFRNQNRLSEWTKCNRLRVRRSVRLSVGSARSAHLVAFLVPTLRRLRFVELLRRNLVVSQNISIQDSVPSVSAQFTPLPHAGGIFSAFCFHVYPQILRKTLNRDKWTCNMNRSVLFATAATAAIACCAAAQAEDKSVDFWDTP
jgi:hypothetical protein